MPWFLASRLPVVIVALGVSVVTASAQTAPLSRRALLAALADQYRFSVAGIELLRDGPIEPLPADWSVKARVMAVLADGADNYIVVDRGDAPGLVRKVVIARADVRLADLARMARETPDIADGRPASAPQYRDTVEDDAVPVPVDDLGTANPPPGSPLVVESEPPVFRDLGTLSPNDPMPAWAGVPHAPLASAVAPREQVTWLMRLPEVRSTAAR